MGWTFKWFDNFLYTVVTFEKKREKQDPTLQESKPFLASSLDTLQQNIAKIPTQNEHTIYYLPFTDKGYTKAVQYTGEERFGNSNEILAHPQTGEIVNIKMDAAKTNGEKFKSLYYELHTGSIGGFWGKTLAFLVSLIGASLPITGVWMYFNRKAASKNR